MKPVIELTVQVTTILMNTYIQDSCKNVLYQVEVYALYLRNKILIYPHNVTVTEQYTIRITSPTIKENELYDAIVRIEGTTNAQSSTRLSMLTTH